MTPHSSLMVGYKSTNSTGERLTYPPFTHGAATMVFAELRQSHHVRHPLSQTFVVADDARLLGTQPGEHGAANRILHIGPLEGHASRPQPVQIRGLHDVTSERAAVVSQIVRHDQEDVTFLDQGIRCANRSRRSQKQQQQRGSNQNLLQIREHGMASSVTAADGSDLRPREPSVCQFRSAKSSRALQVKPGAVMQSLGADQLSWTWVDSGASAGTGAGTRGGG